MNSKLLLIPMAIQFFYLMFFVLYALRVRIRAIKNNEMPGKYFFNYQDKASVPNRFLIIERHIDHQFQVPVVFYVTCLSFIALDYASSLTFLLAGLFVLSRTVHSYIHLGKNYPLHRAAAYGFGLLTIALLWGEILYYTLFFTT